MEDMNTVVFIFLRLYAMTFGRLSFFAKLLKKVMVFVLIKRASKKYVAATKYFDHEDFFKKKENVT